MRWDAMEYVSFYGYITKNRCWYKNDDAKKDADVSGS